MLKPLADKGYQIPFNSRYGFRTLHFQINDSCIPINFI